uniref:Serine/threonine specific protein phosphatases domain-containing protein n=1 Tax=Panagrolaimus sp. JU765 TaxID=591449 RepID=A0AC34RKZ7_9BILA
MVIYDRLRSTKYDQLLYQMIEHGPGSFYVHPMEINEILDKAFCIFSAEETLLELEAPTVIIGDLRGQYCDFFRWLKLTGFPPKQQILILGGFFDGTICGSIELLVFIAALKVALPYNFFVIRGVTEFIGVDLKRGFSRRVCADLSSAALRMFSQMPLAAVISQKILCVHSGISPRIKSFKSISSIKRPIVDLTCSKIVLDLLFNLPDPTIQSTKPIQSGHGHFFGESVVDQVLNRLDLELIVRGRNSSPQGYFLFNNRRVLTLWSAIGRDTSFGVVAVVEKNLEITLKRIQTEEKVVAKTCPKDTLTETQSVGQSVEGQESTQPKSNKL